MLSAPHAGKCAETGQDYAKGDPVLFVDGKGYSTQSTRYQDFLLERMKEVTG